MRTKGVSRSSEVNEYFIKVKEAVGDNLYRYCELPSELQNIKLHRKLTDNGIAKAVYKSCSGHTWMLIY